MASTIPSASWMYLQQNKSRKSYSSIYYRQTSVPFLAGDKKNDLKHSIFLKWIYNLVMRMRKLRITKPYGRMWNKPWEMFKHNTVRSHKIPFPSQQCAFLNGSGFIFNSRIEEGTNQRAGEECRCWEFDILLGNINYRMECNHRIRNHTVGSWQLGHIWNPSLHQIFVTFYSVYMKVVLIKCNSDLRTYL